MKNAFLIALTLTFLLSSCWKDNSPEVLLGIQERFRSQIVRFDKDKQVAKVMIDKGLVSLGALKGELEESKNEDKDFTKVYGDWEKVNRKVEKLNLNFEDLKVRADSLFSAKEDQTNSLSDTQNKTELLLAIAKARTRYSTTLGSTSIAIEKLRALHADAVEVLNALEVAVDLNTFEGIEVQMKNIEGRVEGIMAELNIVIEENCNRREY